MRNKNGMTLVMLVVYILVLVVLAGTITLSFFKSNQIGFTNERAFKSRIKGYMNEFETNKNYYKIKGVDLTTLEIDDLVPSITIADKTFLKLSSTGEEIIFYNMPQTDKKYQYLVSLGLTNTDDILLNLALPLNTQYTSNGITVSVDDNGQVTVNGTYNNDKGLFFRLSDQLAASTAVVDLTIPNITIADQYDDLRYECEYISGSAKKVNNIGDSQFNIALRGYGTNAVGVSQYIIKILEKESISPLNGDFSETTVDVDYAYLYIKGNVQIDNYKFTPRLVKKYEPVVQSVEPDPVDPVEYENPFLLHPGVVTNTGNLTIEVLDDYSIKLNNKASLSKMYVVFLRDRNMCQLNTHNGIGTLLKGYTPIANIGDSISFGIEEISGTVTVPKGADYRCNFVLRSINGATSPITIKSDGKEFACTLNEPKVTNVNGVVATRNAIVLGIFINGPVVFDNYIVRPYIRPYVATN